MVWSRITSQLQLNKSTDKIKNYFDIVNPRILSDISQLRDSNLFNLLLNVTSGICLSLASFMTNTEHI